MTGKATQLEKLAERAELLDGPDYTIEDEIMHALGRVVGNCTASLDAAMKLVPEGCGWMAGWMAGWGLTRPDGPMGGAIITPHAKFAGHSVANDSLAEGEAATPELALTAAALRAHAAMERT